VVGWVKVVVVVAVVVVAEVEEMELVGVVVEVVVGMVVTGPAWMEGGRGWEDVQRVRG